MKNKKLEFTECTEKVPKNNDKCIIFLKSENKTYTDYYFYSNIEDGETFQGFLHSDNGSIINICKGVFWVIDLGYIYDDCLPF